MVTSDPWWTKTVVYQIYPRSFFDTNGDGIGDLRGITSKLDYLKELGVETLWISPFFASPQRDFGYDISDYESIAPEYGDMRECEALIEEAHARGMKIVLDLVLNHTSDQHPWFLESRRSRDNPKRNWYIWRDGRRPGGKSPPNNWRNMIASRGWHYDAATEQWYWSQFLPFQPDLNYRNPEVCAAMFDVIRFWMRKGADGFRLDIINAIFEDPEFRDNPFAWRILPTLEDPGAFFQSPTNTLNHPDTISFMKKLRALVDEFDGCERFMVGEVIAPVEVARAFCEEKGLHLSFLFRSLTVPMQAAAVRRLIEQYEREFAPPLQPTWVFSNHDRVRRISRYGGDVAKAKLNAALQLTARGVPFIYYGEEIGMLQHALPVRDSLDPLAHPYRKLPQFAFESFRRLTGESLNRDECRTPMQWNGGPNAGFCAPHVKPWLPIGPEHHARNVAVQQHDPDSLLSCYRRLLAARRATQALHAGDLRILTGDHPETVLGYARRAGGQEARVFLNFGHGSAVVRNVPDGFRLLVSTSAQRDAYQGPVLELQPWEGVVLIRGAAPGTAG